MRGFRFHLFVLLGLCAPLSPVVGAEPPVVVMFGDSTTRARPGAVEKVYPVRIAEALEAGGEAVRIINRGVGGDHTGGARKRFARDVLAEEPALVVIQFGINDAAVDVWKTPPSTGPRVSREDYVANLRWMVEEARGRGVRVILMTPNPLRWAPVIRERYGRPPYDPGDPLGFEKPFFLGHLEAMRSLADELRVPLVDIHAAYAAHERETGETAEALLLDGIHPNDRGHALVAGRLLPVVREQLKSPPAVSR